VKVFETRDALSDAAGVLVAGTLSTAIAAKGRATAVLTGGSTPGPIYDRLSAAALDWRKVTLTLSDERWVPAGHPDSNETLVRATLHRGLAAPAYFIPLKYDAPDVETGAKVAELAVDEVFPTDLTLLGMGADGHIASLFPGDDAGTSLDPNGPLVVPVALSPTEPRVPRISLSLRALLDTAQIVILVTGEAKRILIERVLTEADYAPPVAAVLRQTKVPVRILWAP
jgi:6-phosphogluconolactonase